MSIFANLIAGYICKDIDAKIEEIKQMDELNSVEKTNVIHGLELAREIVSEYED